MPNKSRTRHKSRLQNLFSQRRSSFECHKSVDLPTTHRPLTPKNKGRFGEATHPEPKKKRKNKEKSEKAAMVGGKMGRGGGIGAYT